MGGKDWTAWTNQRILAAIDKYEVAHKEALEGGEEKAVKLHRSRNKLLPRERINHLIDPEYDQISSLYFCYLKGGNSIFVWSLFVEKKSIWVTYYYYFESLFVSL